MEYTQWVLSLLIHGQQFCVLILVVMEYTQWVQGEIETLEKGVLILVVMEYTQWDFVS